MAKVKYMITFFLFLTVFLFSGESYTFFLENFQEEYQQVGYFLPTGDKEENMNRHILRKAKEFDAEVFALEKEERGAYNRKVIIYGTDGTADILKEDWGIEEGVKKSFFSGKTEFVFEPFEKAGEKAMENCWYPDKTAEELYEMIWPGMVEYSGAYRNEPMKAAPQKVVAGVWLLAGLMIVLLTVYETAYGRKEQSVRMILGEDNRSLIKRRLIWDIGGLTVSIGAAFLILVPFTYPAFEFQTAVLCFGVLLLTNSGAVVFGMRMKRGMILRKQMSAGVPAMSMGLKALTAVLSILILSAALGLSAEGIRLYSQKDFYMSRADRAFIRVDYPYNYDRMQVQEGEGETPMLSADEQLADNLLRYGYQQLECSLFFKDDTAGEIAPAYGNRYIKANLSGLKPYREAISDDDWEKLCTKEGNYLLVSGRTDGEAVLSEYRSFWNLEGISEENFEGIIRYEDGLSVMARGLINTESDYTYRVKNPVIILDTYDYGKYETYPVSYKLRKAADYRGFFGRNAHYYMQFVSVKYDKQKIYDFAEVIGGDGLKPNFAEFSTVTEDKWFEELWALLNRGLLISVILAGVMVFLQLQITIVTLRILYQTKAKELTVKKVMGFSLFQRYRGFFLMTFVICCGALLASLSVYKIFNIGAAEYFLYGSIAVWAFDWAVLTVLSRNMDRRQIQKVLKGGF